jgi:hypothetical protein
MTVTRVLVTGAYGLIGGIIYSHLQAQPEQYEAYALARRRYPSERFPVVLDNKWCWVDLDHGREALGYVPQDSADDRLEEDTA